MEITSDTVREIFSYSPDTGELRWNKRPRSHFSTEGSWKSFNTRFSGRVAGSEHNFNCEKFYRFLTFRDRGYLIHRIIWLHSTGDWPAEEIDHIDGNGLNNRIDNLRDVSHRENARNVKKGSRNTSGAVGVGWMQSKGKYRATIGINRKNISLGHYTDFNDAVDARKKAEIKYGFHDNHGK